MKKIIITTFILLVSSIEIFSQSILSQKALSLYPKDTITTNETINSIQETSDNAFIIAGNATRYDGPKGIYSLFSQSYIIKTDTSGNKITSRLIGTYEFLAPYSLDFALSDKITTIKETSDGGYICVGTSITHGGVGKDVPSNHGMSDIWIIKLKSDLTNDWSKAYGGTSEDEGNSIQQTSDGGYIVAGRTSSNNDDIKGRNHSSSFFGYYGSDLFVLKLKANGDTTWTKVYGGKFTEGYNPILQQTSDGGYIIISTANSNDGDLTGAGLHGTSQDVWILKINSIGTIEWSKLYGGSGNDYSRSIQQTSDGGYIFSAKSESPADGDLSLLTKQGAQDIWICKINSTGTIEWSNLYGGLNDDEPVSCQQLTDGNYLVGAYTSSNNIISTDTHGNNDIWIFTLNPSGMMEWSKLYGGKDNDGMACIIPTKDKNFVIGGYVSSKSGDGDVTNRINDFSDSWLVKINNKFPSIRPPVPPTPPDVYPTLFDLFSFPTIHIDIKDTKYLGSTIDITDAYTGLVKISRLITKMHEEIDISKLPAGTYILIIQVKGTSFFHSERIFKFI